MAAMAGILNRNMTAGQVLTGNAAPTTADASSTSSTNSSSSDSATISANDFLTLLVTEMQNQDPTADTDPNEYINQLVQVNSLEQLIDINQTLSSSLGGTSSSTNGSTTDLSPAAGATGPSATAGKQASSASGQVHGTAPPATQLPGLGASESSALTALAAKIKQAPGNLSVPAATSSSRRVAQALNGQH